MKTCLAALVFVVAAFATANAQLPVTINRSYINSGGRVLLPSFSTTDGTSARTSDTGFETFGGSIRTMSTTFLTNVTGTVSISPSSYPVPSGGVANFTASPIITVVTNAPSSFTNSIDMRTSWRVDGINNGGSIATQFYAFTIIEDGNGGGGGRLPPSVTLTGQIDPLESISRKTSATDPRKLLGFQLVATTNAVLNTLACALSNTSTNGANNFLSVSLFQDTLGKQTFDLNNDLLIATTTNANGFAIFNGLTIPIATSNQTFFVAAGFCPTNQTRNSFVSASLNSQNVVATLAGTNAALQVTGGNILGKQYAFLDTTLAEDAAAASALSQQIAAAIAAIPSPAPTITGSSKKGLSITHMGVGLGAAVGASILGNQLIGGAMGNTGGRSKGTGPRPGYSEKY